MAGKLDFEYLVEQYYDGLYRFALSLAGNENDALDLAQQTFLTWANKGHQLKDPSKVKSWLFTTLHRQFLKDCRRKHRFPETELPTQEMETVTLLPEQAVRVDAATLLQVLQQLDPMFRAPLALYYLEDCSYNEIAEQLEIPIGTVKSRISRAIQQLQALLSKNAIMDEEGASKS